MTDRAALDRLADGVRAVHGGLDVLVNAAGVLTPNAPVDELPADDFRRNFEVNVLGTVQACQAFAPLLRTRRGAVVNVASQAALVSLPMQAAYSAAKGAVASLTRSLAIDWAADGVRVNCVCPGFTLTPMTEAFFENETFTAAATKRIPLGRLLQAREIAGAIVFLASPLARPMTGRRDAGRRRLDGRRAGTPVVMERYRLHIDGAWVDAASGRTFQTVDPFTGEAWAEVPDGGAEDVERAVRAAAEALRGPWGAMTGKERARLLRRLAELLARDAEALAAFETRDNGKLLREMVAQCRALPDYYEYFAGAADKIEGEVIPTDKPNFLVYTRHEPVGVVGGDRRLELAAPADDLEARPGARGRLHVRLQAVGADAGVDARVRAAGRGGRLPAGRLQRRHRPRSRDRAGAHRPPGRRQGRVHGLDPDGDRDREGGRGEPHPRLARARREVAEHRLRGRRPRRGAATG